MAALDLLDPQVLVYYPDDPEVGYHHRLLLRGVGGASWIACSPDFELDLLDVVEHPIIAVAQGSAVPRRVLGDVYLFDEFDNPEQLEELRRESARMATRSTLASATWSRKRSQLPRARRARKGQWAL